MKMKPHKGKISDWHKVPSARGLGFTISGMSHGHPDFDGERIRTSYVEKYDEATGKIETRNSRYTLIGSETLA